MKKHLIIPIALLASALVVFLLMPGKPSWKNPDEQELEETEQAEEGMEEDVVGRFNWMRAMLADPYTRLIPEDIRRRELAFAATLPVSAEKLGKSDYGHWIQRGPGNVGGRTRAVVIDIDNENTMFAGATAGGIWRSLDHGDSWQRISADTDYVPVSTIVQDIRPGKTQTWYAGTGERYGGALPGGYIYGNGIRKSTDGGKTWKRLGATYTPNPQFDISFDFVHRLVINTAIDSLDVVFAATYDGVFRSTDGGNTWSRRRGGSASGASDWTDVAITRTGIVYAALSSGGHTGIWRSINNGATWTNISPPFFSNNCGRIVMALAPSDENQIYFTAFTPGTGKKSVNFNGDEEWNSLWKYTYVSGDGTGNGGIWEDRSENIPTGFPGDFGQFISQQGYSLHVDVKPDDPNLVFLGGTNLYRSTDGFKTASNITQVGGYAVGTKRPDYKMYPNHHPDQHGVIFYRSNPNRAISMDDGGIQLTTDCTAPSITWESLNHGYVTTQFYTIAIDHSSTNPMLIGGLQDNGTQLSYSENYLEPWVMPYSSDGSHCFVAPNATEYYVSIQQGRVYRILLDGQYNLTQMARLDPKGQNKDKYQFINPFAVDRNEWKRLYIPCGNLLWRNNDVSVIPLHPTIDSNAVLTGWQELSVARLPDSTDEITAITSSTAIPDVVYYGTMRGKLYRLSDASTATPSVQNITGTNFPNAYLNCIATDPQDSLKLYAVFSNYGVLSVFASVDGGSSWNPISGNLEENTNGSGNGPSCRWLTIAHLTDSTLYFLGTSTGLFATAKLNGMNTVWSRQGPKSIAYHVVTMMDFRNTDNTLAVATYGAGAFTAKISSVDRTGVKKPSYDDFDFSVYPNPAVSQLHIYTRQDLQEATITWFDLAGKQVGISKPNAAATVDLTNLPKGILLMKLDVNGKSAVRKVLIH